MELNTAIICDDISCIYNDRCMCTFCGLQLQWIGDVNSVPRCNSKKISKEYRREIELHGDVVEMGDGRVE